MTARAALVIAFAALGAAVTPARADAPDARRKVVVLEYRAGSAALPAIADRVAARMRKLTSLSIIDPNAARQRIGNLDERIVKCGGEADCLAAIGQTLGVEEVVLVGISELGDVILTLQRIAVKRRAVEARIAESLAPSDMPNDETLAQYLSRLLPASDFIRFGLIRVIANREGARVTLAGEDKGVTPIEPIRVRAPASYDIRVVKSGYVPFSASVQVPPDGEIAVKATLEERGRGGGAWYQKWWVLAIAGAAVVGATGTAIYVGTRSSDRVTVGGVIE